MPFFLAITSFFYSITSFCHRTKQEPVPINIPNYDVSADIRIQFKDNNSHLTNSIRYQTLRMPLNAFGLQPPFRLYDDVPIPHFKRTYNLQMVICQFPLHFQFLSGYEDHPYYRAEFEYETNTYLENVWIPIPRNFFNPSYYLAEQVEDPVPHPPATFWTRLTRWTDFLKRGEH